MISKIRYEFFQERRVYVKPVTDKTEMFGWIVLSLTPWQSFLDDRKRYGLGVAIYNIRHVRGQRWDIKVDSGLR